MPLLRVNDLRAYYRTEAYGISRTVRAVDGVSFELQRNEIYGLAGESSCGKTTLIKVLSGTIKPPLRKEGGSLIYTFNGADVDMDAISDEQLRTDIRWKEISYVMQGSMSVLNPVRRVRRVFRHVVDTHQGINDKRGFYKLCRDHLQRLGLPPEVLDAYPHQLSGGMKQRVALALATIFHPSLIIADEPTTALDVVVQRGVLQLLKEIQAESRNTVLLVTHDMAVHANVADRVAIMYAGRIVEEGPTETIFQAPQHPYTQHLIGSLPTIGDKATRKPLGGSPPSLAQPPEGCRFHPRCPMAMEICRRTMPEMRWIADGHRAACHLLEPVAIGDGGPAGAGATTRPAGANTRSETGGRPDATGAGRREAGSAESGADDNAGADT